jgi:hypothetical protein
MNNTLIYKILKYIALGTAVYLVFRFVPNHSLSNSDILTISAITLLVYILLEYLSKIFFTKQNKISEQDKIQMCSSVCSVPSINNGQYAPVNYETEHMESLANTQPSQAPQPQIVQPSKETQSPLTQKEVAEKHKNDTLISEQNPNSDVLSDELSYSEWKHTPIGEEYEDVKRNYEYGFSFLPPLNWYPGPPVPPMCKKERPQQKCTTFDSTVGLDIREWDNSRRITQADNIKINYIQDKLNSGY